MIPFSRRQIIQLGAASGALLASGPRFRQLAAAQATPAAGEPITIGLLAPVTGVFADFGDLMTKATNLVVQKINDEGGILGRPLLSSPKTIRAIRPWQRSGRASCSSRTTSTS